MTRTSWTMCLSILTLAGASRADSQETTIPRFRHANPSAHARRMLDSVVRLDREVGAARRVLIDSVNAGSFWLDFNLDAAAEAAAAPTAQGAADAFLATYAPKVFGVGPAPSGLVLQSVKISGILHHLRYAQQHGEYRIFGGQVAVHVASTSRGYVVQSVNGHLFPDVIAPEAPSISSADARRAAVSGMARSGVPTREDTPLMIVPDGAGYRLAYLVPLVDTGRGQMVTRFVDAQGGTVFGELPAFQTAAPSSRQPHVPRAAVSVKGNRPKERRSVDGYIAEDR